MDLTELSQADWINLCIYGSLATYVAMAIPRLFRGNAAGALRAMVFWVVLFAAIIAGYSYRFELQDVGNRMLATIIPGAAVQTGPGEVTVVRQIDGQFVVNARIGAIRLPFVLDTGASAVVLRAEDAARLRLPLDRLRYDVEVGTANGRSLAASVDLPQIEVGPIVQRHVRALVARPGALHENLLGMTFLNELGSVTIARDRLVLRAR